MLDVLIRRGEWDRQASCQYEDPDLFFPEQGESSRAARQICAGCPVRMNCLIYALEVNEEFGIWGGLNRSERNSYRKAIISRYRQQPFVGICTHCQGTFLTFRNAPISTCKGCTSQKVKAEVKVRQEITASFMVANGGSIIILPGEPDGGDRHVAAVASGVH